MKKIISLVLLVVFATSLVACSNSDNAKIKGIYPYVLSESEENLLRAFGLDSHSQAISFHAPPEAISLCVNVYVLDENEKWKTIGGGGFSTGVDRNLTKDLTGMFAMQRRHDYSIAFSITRGGVDLYTTGATVPAAQIVAAKSIFLTGFQEIELDKEIPIALMIYTSSNEIIRSNSLEDYFEPTRFAGMDLVQAVTLTFSDKEV